MPNIECRLCHGTSRRVFGGRVLGRHDISYFECGHCGYVQTEAPHWLQEAYHDPINETDTGIVTRNAVNARIVQSTLLTLPRGTDGVADFAGGYGLLVRMLRDAGVNAFWRDPFCANLFAKGFEYHGQPISLATAFEAFEHFVDPLAEAATISKAATTILLSTELMPATVPEPRAWWYYGLDHGQHIGFFRLCTLAYLAQRLGMRLLSDGQSYHVLTREAVSEKRWRLFKRCNALILVRNRLGRRSLTQSDFETLLQRKDA